MQSNQAKPTDLAPTKPISALLPSDLDAGRLIRLPAVSAATGQAKSTIWSKVRQSLFPQPLRFGRITAWRAADVAEWLNDPAGWMAAHAPKSGI